MVPPEEKPKPSGAEGEVSPESSPSENGSTAKPSDSAPEQHYDYHDDPYSDYGEGYTSSSSDSSSTALVTATAPPVEAAPPAPPPPPPAGPSGEEPDEDEEGMARMSFFEHLEELRRRILYALAGLIVAFGLSLTFANALWKVVSRPAVAALQQLGVVPPKLAQTAPVEYFYIVWMKLPLLAAVFLASPWLLYQLWAFIAPGLYKRERRWAAPFVISTAGLFISGGLFGYFVVFRFALVFLLGLGLPNDVQPIIKVEDYFDMFVNVMLGIGLVFELPVLIFFLILIRLVTPAFLMRNIRYAILGIFVIAAIATPTPDIFNMVLFAMPMCLLFFVGIGAGYFLELRREKKKFPWGPVLRYTFGVLAVVAALLYYLHRFQGYHVVRHFPWYVR